MKEKEQSCGTKKLMGLFLTGKRKNKLAGLFIDFKGANRRKRTWNPIAIIYQFQNRGATEV